MLVFQHGQGQDGVIFSMPLVLFLFVVAIGTDYNILMSARLREELADGVSPREATARAVRRVAPAITAAGLVLAASFATLMLHNDVNTKEIGFGMAVGILIASFVVSTLLVPAVTTLVGKRAWWPPRPRRGAVGDRARQGLDACRRDRSPGPQGGVAGFPVRSGRPSRGAAARLSR